jgi:hypothetical protein
MEASSVKADDVVNRMMKIQVRELDDQLILQVEGRLAGAFVPELEGCWQSARAKQPDRQIAVDLKSVTCIDRCGRSLLRAMHSEGVGFLRAGLAIQDILQELIEEKECTH